MLIGTQKLPRVLLDNPQGYAADIRHYYAMKYSDHAAGGRS